MSVVFLGSFLIGFTSATKRSGVQIIGLTRGPGFTRKEGIASIPCPPDHPFAYGRGHFCCGFLFRLNDTSIDPSCIGTKSNVYTPESCCPNSALLPCPALKGPCKSRGKYTKWSSWSEWSLCTVTCGPGGTQTRTRSLIYHDDVTEQEFPCPTQAQTSQTDVRLNCHNFNCACKTTSGSTANAACKFPWYYTGLYGTNTWYPACTRVQDTGNWCLVSGSSSTFTSGGSNWGYCAADCPACLTVDGPVVNASCLKFTYQFVTYSSCTTVDNGSNNGKAWCATGSDPTTQWGICDDSRLCAGGN